MRIQKALNEFNTALNTANLLEAAAGDRRLREAERAWKQSGDPNARSVWHQELLRAGRRHTVMADLVNDHLATHRQFREALHSPDDEARMQAFQAHVAAKQAVTQTADQLGEHPADHMHRHPDESDADFMHRLVELNSHMSSTHKVAPHRDGAFGGGTLSFEASAQERPDDPIGLGRAHAIARAWERSGGRAVVGHRTRANSKTGQEDIVGSYVGMYPREPEAQTQPARQRRTQPQQPAQPAQPAQDQPAQASQDQAPPTA